MESYREIIEKAKKLEAVVNSLGSDIHLQRAIELVGCEEMKLIAGCLIRQIYRETKDDFNGAMMDDRNRASFELTKQLMSNPKFAEKMKQVTPFFTPLGAEEMRFHYCERIYNRMQLSMDTFTEAEIEVVVITLYLVQIHRTLQQNVFRVCCQLLKEDGLISDKVYLPYI